MSARKGAAPPKEEPKAPGKRPITLLECLDVVKRQEDHVRGWAEASAKASGTKPDPRRMREAEVLGRVADIIHRVSLHWNRVRSIIFHAGWKAE